MALYNDRVYAYERMKALSPVLVSANNEQLKQFCSDDDRNYLAFQELRYFEKHGEFLYLHPLLQSYKQENELEILRRSNPREFAKQMLNAQKSIERYTSRINNKKYKNEKELADWRALVDKYIAKVEMMRILISK